MSRTGCTAWVVCICLACMVSAALAQTDNSFEAQLIVVEIGAVPRSAQPPQPAAQFAVNRLTDGSSLNAPCPPLSLHAGSNANPPLFTETFRRISQGCPVDLTVQFPLSDPLTNASDVRPPGAAGPVLVAVVMIPDVPRHVPVRVILGIRRDVGHETGSIVLPAAQVFRPGE